jgi:hypothetical protein
MFSPFSKKIKIGKGSSLLVHILTYFPKIFNNFCKKNLFSQYFFGAKTNKQTGRFAQGKTACLFMEIRG